MNQQIFTIKGTHESFFNLKDAINRAEELVQDSLSKRLKRISKDYGDEYNRRYQKENLKRYTIHFTTTMAYLQCGEWAQRTGKDNSIKVRGVYKLPTDDGKYETFSKSYIINASALPSVSYPHNVDLKI